MATRIASREIHARVLADARRRYEDGLRLNLNWTWAQCLKTAYAAERLRVQSKPVAQPATINWGVNDNA